MGSSIWKPEFSSAVSNSSHAVSLAVALCMIHTPPTHHKNKHAS